MNEEFNRLLTNEEFNRFLLANADLCRRFLESEAKELGVTREEAAAALIRRSDDLIHSLRSNDPLNILESMMAYYLVRGAGLSISENKEDFISCTWSMTHIIFAGRQIKELRDQRNSHQRKGGIARHEKTRQIKGFLMERWSEGKEKAKSKRAFARAILPEVYQRARELGHQFPDDYAALEFIAKSLPKTRDQRGKPPELAGKGVS